jgi:hypothetical protein
MVALTPFSQAPSPETIRHVTREVLSRPDFSAPSTWEEMIASLVKAIGEGLKGFASWASNHPELARVVAVVLVVALLGCLAHLLYLILGDLLSFGRKEAAAPIRPSRWDILEGTAKNWREALEVARRMIKEGDARRAIWIAHRVLLGLLDEQGAIRFARWKTNSHYLKECARSHPWYGTFAELTEAYEQAIYAHRVAASSSLESLVVRLDQFCTERVR